MARILVIVVMVILGALIAARAHRRFLSLRGRRVVERVLAAHGARRCCEATRLLSDLAARGDSAAIVRDFNAIEMPLVQAIPDCPQDAKAELIAALDGCARSCRVVEVTARIMTVRNSLLA